MKTVREQVDFCVAIDHVLGYRVWNWITDEISEKIWDKVELKIYYPIAHIIKNKIHELS